MADKQISELTENSTPATTDLFVCQQNSNAKKISLSGLRDFILKITGLSSTATTLQGTEVLLVNQSSTPKKMTLDNAMTTLLQTVNSISDSDYFPVHANNYPRKVAASTLKAYCGGGGSGGAFYAEYGITPWASVLAAYNAGKAMFCKDDWTICPICECMEGDGELIENSQIAFLDSSNSRYLIINDSSTWSRVSQ